jgi:proline iminopeptidase
MPAAAINGTSIHYELDGRGPSCLVLHGGLGLDHVLYRRTLAPLAERLRLVHLDHRGNGRSAAVALDTVTMQRLADDATALADRLGLERFSVLGHSYGGFIAQELALRHGSRLEGLILVATTPGQLGRDESADDEQGPPPPADLVARLSSLPASDDELATRMGELLPYYFHTMDPDHVAPLFEGTIYRAGMMTRGFEVLSTWSSVDRLGEIAAPTLLLVGRHDVFTSYPQSYRIARRIPDAEIVVFEGSGHFPWIEEPDVFFAAVCDWLGRKLTA